MSNTQPLFTVEGPLQIPTEWSKSGAKIIPVGCPDFWKEHPEQSNSKGCFVFAVQAAKGFRPIYVGKTRRTFKDECFTAHKIAQHYGPALANVARGTPVMFLVIAEKAPGPPNTSAIEDLEKFLIQVGVAKNPELSNIANRNEAHWGIKGVLRGGKGKTSRSAQCFKKAMGI